MSRFVTIAVVVAVIFSIHVIQLAATDVLGHTRTTVVEDGESWDVVDQNKVADQIYAVLTKWMVVIVDGGILLWALVREFRRARTTATRPPGG